MNGLKRPNKERARGRLRSPLFILLGVNAMKIKRIDPFTGKTNEMDLPITTEQYDRWQSGVLIQYAFPDLTPTQREFIKTGIMDWPWPNDGDFNE